MRISYWSSDVCSSDLPIGKCRGLRNTGNDIERVAQFRFADRQHYRGACFANGIGIEALTHQPAAADADTRADGGVMTEQFREIGRAAWRERVGHYVYYRVGARDLIKKNSNNKN